MKSDAAANLHPNVRQTTTAQRGRRNKNDLHDFRIRLACPFPVLRIQLGWTCLGGSIDKANQIRFE